MRPSLRSGLLPVGFIKAADQGIAIEERITHLFPDLFHRRIFKLGDVGAVSLEFFQQLRFARDLGGDGPILRLRDERFNPRLFLAA